MNSIKIVFPALFAALILVSVGIVATIALVSQTRDARETAHSMLDLIGGTIDDNIYNNLTSAYNLTRIYAKQIRDHKTPIKGDVLAPDFVHYMIDSVRTQSLMSRGLNLSVSSPKGQNLTLDRRRTATPVVKLSDIQKGGQLSWYAFDSYGKSHEALEIEDIHFDPRQQESYQRALILKDTVTSKIHRSPLAPDAFVISISEPVFDLHSNLEAMVSTDVDLRTIGIYLRGLRLPEGTVVFVYNSDGNLLATTLRQSDEATGEKDFRVLPLLIHNHDSLMISTAEEILHEYGTFEIHEKKIFKVSSDGQSHYVYTAPLNNNFDLNWKLAVIIPEAGLIRNLLEGIHLTAWITLGLILTAITFGLGLAGWVIRPIITLGTAAAALEKNQLMDPPLPVKELEKDTHRQNEFGQVARIFLRMVEEIRTRHRLLEMQLEQLRVDISHEETHEELKKITNSDFFIELKERAGDMRARRISEIKQQVSNTDKDLESLSEVIRTTIEHETSALSDELSHDVIKPSDTCEDFHG